LRFYLEDEEREFHMKIRWAIPNSSIFPKLVLTFIAVILPLFALSLVLNELAKKEVKSQISEVMRARLHYELKSLEQELDRIMNSQQQIVNDGDLLDLAGQTSIMSNYQRTDTINRLSDKLRSLKDLSPLIREVRVYIPSIERVVSTYGVMKDGKPIAEIKALATEEGFPIIQSQGRLFLNLVFPNSTTIATKALLFIHQIELSSEAINERLGQFSEGGGAALISDRWMLAHNEQNAWFDKVQKVWVPDPSSVQSTATLSIEGKNYMVFYEKSMLLDLEIKTYIPEDILLGKLKNYRIWFWLLVACSLVMVLVFSYGIFLLIHRPLTALVRQFRSVEDGNFHIVQKQWRRDEFGYLFNRFERTVKRLKQLIDELYVQKIRLQQSELKQLQAQIMPHFLYNSFFILHQLIKSHDNDKAEQISKNLGSYFQYITRTGKEEVSLKTELDHVRSYIEIQNIRFSKRIVSSIDLLPERYERLQVPRLILQPIIENAYQHGLVDTVRGGMIQIGFNYSMNRITVRVEDNGAGMNEEKLLAYQANLRGFEGDGIDKESTGMINVHRRLELKYGQSGGVELIHGNPNGLIVLLHIPIEGGNKDA
jgi:two-component system sensor histidine kinase YesM